MAQVRELAGLQGHPGCRNACRSALEDSADHQARSARFTCAATIGSFILAQGLRLLQRHVLADHAHTGLATGLVLPCIGLELNTTEPVAPSAGQAQHAHAGRQGRALVRRPIRRGGRLERRLAGGRPRTRILLLPVGLPPLLLLLLILF